MPGLDVVLPGPPGLSSQVVRSGDNQWLIGLGGAAHALATIELHQDPAPTDPGHLASRARGDEGFLARIELDTCGAWVTVACTADLRPLVVRRAGWVDERGDAVVDRSEPWPEDRVGLGPGDAVAVVHSAGSQHTGDKGAVDPVAECLLDHLGTGAQGLVDATCGTPSRVVAAVAVPASVAGVGPGWVAEATGVAESDLVLPGYPLGDREPERWRLQPSVPRRAAFRLHRDVARLSDLRGVLGRLVRSWRLEERVDDALLTLLTTELATNALVHTDTAATATITFLGTLVRVEVHDGSPLLPVRREPEAMEIGGRGIALIEELASSWGSSPTATGKRTWFDLPVAAQVG